MPKSPSSSDWLAAFTDECRQNVAVIRRFDRRKLAIDKAARRLDVEFATRYLRRRPRLIRELDKRGMTEKEWCRTLGRGHSLSSVLRRIQLLKGFARYLQRRDEIGDNGCFGLDYAVSLARPDEAEGETSSRPTTRRQIADETPAPEPDLTTRSFTG